MLNGHFVIDATTHPYNLGPENTTPNTSPWRGLPGTVAATSAAPAGGEREGA